MTKDMERAQLRERLEFLERSMIIWERHRLELPDGPMAQAAQEQLEKLRAAWEKARKRLERLRNPLTLPF